MIGGYIPINFEYDCLSLLKFFESKNYTIGKEIIYLELKPGDLAILHNHLLHASDINTTDSPRRALSICYMDGNTKHKIESEKKYTFLFNT